jgi:hypothetical protein
VTQRWPVHPRPWPGEALASWLDRIAEIYGMSLDTLVRHNLGPAGFTDQLDRDWLDLDPPEQLLVAVHERSGVPLAELRSMTLAGWVPWLADALDPDVPDAFTTFIRHDSVLFASRAVPAPALPRWRAWLPVDPSPRSRRGCPRCAALPGRGLPLMAQIPVMLSCVEHACALVPTNRLRLLAALGQDDEPAMVSDAVVAMDRRTHEAVTSGAVQLPGRSVHVGVWFRLLRTLLDEVNTPVSYLRQADKRALWQIWQHTGQPARAGQVRWVPYENLDWARQQAMLEAAATAMYLIEIGVLRPWGTLGAVLREEPYRPVRSEPDPATAWRLLLKDFNAAIEAAQHDRDAALRLLQTYTAYCRSPAAYEQRRQNLIACGLPERFLPRWEDRDADGRSVSDGGFTDRWQ